MSSLSITEGPFPKKGAGATRSCRTALRFCALLLALAVPAYSIDSGVPYPFAFPAQVGWTLYNGSRTLYLAVPAGTSSISIQLTGLSGADSWKIYARFGSDVGLGGGTLSTVVA